MKLLCTTLLFQISFLCLFFLKHVDLVVASRTDFYAQNCKIRSSFFVNVLKKQPKSIHRSKNRFKQKHLRSAVFDSSMISEITALTQDNTILSHSILATILTALESMKTEVETLPSNTNMIHLAGDVVAGLLGGSIGVFGTLVSLEWKVQQMEEESKCPYCQGAGILPCAPCNGSGQCQSSNCKICAGAGHLNCINCKGEGLAVPLALDKKVNRDPDTPLERYGFGLKPNPTIRNIKDGTVSTSPSTFKNTDSPSIAEVNTGFPFIQENGKYQDFDSHREEPYANVYEVNEYTSLNKYYRFSTRIKYKRGLIKLPETQEEETNNQQLTKKKEKRELELTIN